MDISTEFDVLTAPKPFDESEKDAEDAKFCVIEDDDISLGSLPDDSSNTDDNCGDDLDDIDPALDDFKEAMKMAEDQLKLAMSTDPTYDDDDSHSNNSIGELGVVSTPRAKIKSDSNNVDHHDYDDSMMEDDDLDNDYGGMNPAMMYETNLDAKRKVFSPGEVPMSLLHTGKKGQNTVSHVDETYEELNTHTSAAPVERSFFPPSPLNQNIPLITPTDGDLLESVDHVMLEHSDINLMPPPSRHASDTVFKSPAVVGSAVIDGDAIALTVPTLSDPVSSMDDEDEDDMFLPNSQSKTISSEFNKSSINSKRTSTKVKRTLSCTATRKKPASSTMVRHTSKSTTSRKRTSETTSSLVKIDGKGPRSSENPLTSARSSSRPSINTALASLAKKSKPTPKSKPALHETKKTSKDTKSRAAALLQRKKARDLIKEQVRQRKEKEDLRRESETKERRRIEKQKERFKHGSRESLPIGRPTSSSAARKAASLHTNGSTPLHITVTNKNATYYDQKERIRKRSKDYRKEEERVARDRSRPRAPTIPKTPRLCTKIRGGEKLFPSSSPRSHRSHSSDAGSAFCSSITTASSNARPRKLTKPMSPKLSTASKLGVRQYSSTRNPKDEESFHKKETPSPAGPRKLTEVEPFNLSASKAPKDEKSTCSGLTMAEEMNRYTREGLRDIPPPSPSNWPREATRPVSPNLSFKEATPRALPKSAAEIEEAKMSYFEAHPFKARLLNQNVLHSRGDQGVPKKQSPKKLTEVKPFNLATETLIRKRPDNYVTKENIDMEECKKQFRARPISINTALPPSVPKKEIRTLTTPKAFQLSTPKSHPPTPTTNDIEMGKKFHAKKMPDFTFKGVLIPGYHSIATALKSTPTASGSKSANFIARVNVKERMKERKRLAEEKKRKKRSPIPKTKKITVPEPFHLTSDVRNAAYQLSFQAKIEEENKQEAERAIFKARPIPKHDLSVNTKSMSPKSSQILTEPVGFNLRTDFRHQSYEAKIRARMEETERRRLSLSCSIKANPVPRSLHSPGFTPTRPSLRGRVAITGSAPKLRSESRTKARNEYDEEADKRRQEKERKEKVVEEEREAAITKEISERRRLPVSEGGFIPKAKAINEVFEIRRRSFSSSFSSEKSLEVGQVSSALGAVTL